MRVAKMAYSQQITKRDKKGRVLSSYRRVRIPVPDGLPPSLPPPYTGHKNLTKKVQTDREHAEWTARFLAIVDEVRGSTTIHRELAEINRLSLVELIGRGPAPCRVFAKLDRKMDKIFGEPAWKKVTAEPVTYESFIDKWMDKTKNGKKKGPKAREDMERAVRRFTAWLRSKNLPHHDITQVRFENCRDYRDHLYTSDPNPDHFKTHSNHLATLKALFSRAAKGRHLPANPFADLEWDRGKENRRPDFTREERARILRLARSAEDPVIKWGNVLAALGGYRNEELADAHARDVYRKNGIWVLHIREDNRTPDQRLKTPSRTRIMPLHSAILEEGFLKFVEPVGDRPLFHHLKLYGYGRRTSEFTAIINEWLHETVGTEKTFYSHRHTVTSILRNPSGRMVALLLTGIFNAICSATAKRMCTAAMARVGSRL
jgi:Phage integrase SAM-like domain